MTHAPTAYLTKTDTLNVFFTRATTTLTLLDETLTDLLKVTKLTHRHPTPVTTVTIPYIKGSSETITRILQPYNIRVAHKPKTTLQHLLTNVKDRDEPDNRQGAVYKIKSSDP